MNCSNCKLPLPTGPAQTCPACFTVNRPKEPSKPKLTRKPARKPKPAPASKPAIDDEPESE
jgi:hypothetical protein